MKKKTEKCYYMVTHPDYLVETAVPEQMADCICKAYMYSALPIFFSKKDAKEFALTGEKVTKVKIVEVK